MTTCRILPFLLALLVLASPAAAQVSTDELARELVAEGIEAARELDWVTARDRFERAYAIQPLPLTLFNLATAQEKTGQLVEADRSYRIFLRETSEGQHDRFRKVAVKRRTALERRIAYVEIQVPNLAPSDVLKIGEQELAHAVLGRPIPSNPGRIKVSVVREGEVIGTRQVRVTEGSSHQVSVAIPVYTPPAARVAPAPAGPSAATAAAGAPTAPTLETERDSRGDSGDSIFASPWFWATVGVVVAAGAATGLYFGLRPDDPYESSVDRITLTGE